MVKERDDISKGIETQSKGKQACMQACWWCMQVGTLHTGVLCADFA